MKIIELKLENYRLFDNLEVEFPDSNITVLVGVNGSGKSTLLDAIAQTLFPVIQNILLAEKLPSVSSKYENDDIKVGNRKSKIYGKLSYMGKGFSSESVKEVFLKPIEIAGFPFTGMKNEESNISFNEHDKFPLIQYYGVERTNLIESKKDKSKIELGDFIKGRFIPYYSALNGSLSVFSEFEEWYAIAEDYENEQRLTNDNRYRHPSLEIIRKAIIKGFSALGDNTYSDLRIKRKVSLNKESSDFAASDLYLKHGIDFIKVKRLSSGERAFLLLVSDIARRLGVLNNFDDDSLQKEGIILIDEIELHLHPRWQRNVITALTTVFPNVQFIITTHSPQVISSVKSRDILVLSDSEIHKVRHRIKGLDSNSILQLVFENTQRPLAYLKLVDKIDFAIEAKKPIVEIEGLIKKVEELDAEDNGDGNNPLIEDLQIQLESYKYDLEYDSDN